jgi:methionyl-tRNA formyltransferase
MSQKIIFFGNERLGIGLGTDAPVLKALIKEGYEIVALVVAQNEPSKSRNHRPLEVVELAAQNRIPVFSPEKLTDIKEELQSKNAKAGVLIAYGKIVPKSIIDIFPRGIINIHPSLLPLHRGPTPIESVILQGEAETGISLMKLIDKMDAGPIYAQTKIKLSGREYKDELVPTIMEQGSNLLIENLPNILNGSLEAIKQNDSMATYDKKIEKSDGDLNFSKSASDLDRQIKAFVGWPRSRTTIGSTDVIVTRAHVADIDGTPGTLYFEGQLFGIHCQKGTLMIDRIIPAGKNEMTGSDFLLGYTP